MLILSAIYAEHCNYPNYAECTYTKSRLPKSHGVMSKSSIFKFKMILNRKYIFILRQTWAVLIKLWHNDNTYNYYTYNYYTYNYYTYNDFTYNNCTYNDFTYTQTQLLLPLQLINLQVFLFSVKSKVIYKQIPL